MTPIQLNDRVQISDEGHRRGIAFRTRPGRSKTLVAYATVVGFSRDGSCAWVTPDGAKYRTRLSLDFLELAPDAGPAPEPASDQASLQQQLDAAKGQIAGLEKYACWCEERLEATERKLATAKQIVASLVPKRNFDPAVPKTLGTLVDALHGLSNDKQVELLSRYCGEGRKRVLLEVQEALAQIEQPGTDGRIEARCTGSTTKPQEASLLSLGEQDKLQG